MILVNMSFTNLKIDKTSKIACFERVAYLTTNDIMGYVQMTQLISRQLFQDAYLLE